MLLNKTIIKIINEIIDVLENNGVEIKSPYDLIQFIEDYICDERSNYSYIYATRRFDDPDEDRY